MYFLRWLYREVNPMILILGLVSLYFLFSLATCSDSTNSVVSDSTNAVKESVAKVSEDNIGKVDADTAAVVENSEVNETPETDEVVSNADQQSGNADDKTVVAINTQEKPVESVLSKALNEKKPTGNELNADITAEAGQATRPSILNRVFKKAENAETATKEVVEEVTDSGSKAATAVATGAAVATAGAVSAVAADEGSAAEVAAEVATEIEEVEEVAETENEEKGGFFGLFSRSKEEDEVVVTEEAEVESTEIAEVEEQVEQEITEEKSVVAETHNAEEQSETKVAETEELVEEAQEVVETEVADGAEAIAEEAEAVQEEVAEKPVQVAVAPQPAADQTVTGSASSNVPPPPSYSTNISSDQEALSAARRAFWDRDYAKADTLYSEMIAKEAGNPELIAEYGNMLLQSGQVEKTLDAYEKAAGLMIDNGRKLEAKPLIDYISSWDQERADQLINKVFAQ